MDLDKFENQIRQLKEKKESYFYLNNRFGSVRFSWDELNNHYQIVQGVGLVIFFDDYSVSKDGTYLSFYRWHKCDDKFIQSVCAIILLDNNGEEHIVTDLIEKVSE